MTKYFCDWCGKEKPKIELKPLALRVSEGHEPLFKIEDCCVGCRDDVVTLLKEELEDLRARRDETGLSA